MTEDKTNKFIKIDEFSSLLESLIQKENDKHSIAYPVSVFDPAHLTECPRRIIYRANGCVPETSLPYLNIVNELFNRKKWLEYLSKCKSIKIIDKNLVTADCHYNISGNADAILSMDGNNYVIKIQAVSDDEFNQINKKGAFKRHVIELMVYMWLTELQDGLLLYENQNTNKYTVFHIKPYDPIIKSVTKKCTDLMEDKIQGNIPNRPYKTKDSSECGLCEFSKQCWG